MNQKKLFQRSTNKVVTYVERFLNLPFGKMNTMMLLKTIPCFSKGLNSYQLTISSNNYKSNITLLPDLDILLINHKKLKRYIYEQIFWELLDVYEDNERMRIDKKYYKDFEEREHWQLVFYNLESENIVTFEFEIEDYQDSLWISNMFDKYNNKLNKVKKIENK